MSRLVGAGGSSAILIRHFLQVPWPPQVESIASNRVTPDGTRTGCPLKSRLTRTGPGTTSSVTVTWHPAGVLVLQPAGRALLAGHGGPRSRPRPTRRG